MKPENKSTYFKIEISKEGDTAKGTVEIKMPEKFPETTITPTTVVTETTETTKTEETEAKPKKKGKTKIAKK